MDTSRALPGRRLSGLVVKYSALCRIQYSFKVDKAAAWIHRRRLRSVVCQLNQRRRYLANQRRIENVRRRVCCRVQMRQRPRIWVCLWIEKGERVRCWRYRRWGQLISRLVEGGSLSRRHCVESTGIASKDTTCFINKSN